MKLKRTLALLLLAATLLVCVLPLFACGTPCTAHADANKDGKCDTCGTAMPCETHTDANKDGKCDVCQATVEAPPAPGKTRYTVQVKTVGGMPLADVMVYVHKGDGFEIRGFQATDADGCATFELDTADDYSIQLDAVPDGYHVKGGMTREDRYAMGVAGASIMLASSPIQGAFAKHYELGDVMHDFTIQDVNGNSYTLSALLQEKKMVMLNFWFSTCSPCQQEFPGLNDSYKLYGDDVAVLAINDYSPDSLETVKGFATSQPFEEDPLVMPFFKIENNANNLINGRFHDDPPAGQGYPYPTTVIIDRYGVICMLEAGAIIGQSKWDKIFSHFTAENYEQKLIENASDLTPPELPNVSWGGSEGIANNFNASADMQVEYAPETNPKDAPYSWPFIPETVGNIPAVRPSNKSDNSYAILYATVQLKPGQAVMFDYFASTEYGNDNLIVVVDGKDICSLTGVNPGDKTNLADWETCCAYVDPRPVTAQNQDVLQTYQIGLTYIKDSDTGVGDDTVYLTNLRIASATEIPTETYIFRYAATDPWSNKAGYDTYVEVVLGADGYYHVKNLDGTPGPLLLANFLNYSQFDSKMTMSQRLTTAEKLMVNGVDRYGYWMIYANAAANSKVTGYTPVTPELKDMLDAYCKQYATAAGKDPYAAPDQLWLQLCIYYDAYGKDENGDPTKHMADPIEGLTTFSAFPVGSMENPANGDKITCTVTYDRVIMPRGLLYRFVPSVSGAYRVTSFSSRDNSLMGVDGWILYGTSHDWVDNGGVGERLMLIDSELEERFYPGLYYENENGDTVRDSNNVSMVRYLEAGKEYFINIAYKDIYAEGSFDFEIMYVDETFSCFEMASPGPATYILTADGGMGQYIALGIDYTFAVDPADGKTYAYHVLERENNDPNGKPTKLGSKLYADFTLPTIPFPSQSIVTLNKLGGFDFSMSDLDIEAMSYWQTIREKGAQVVIAEWVAAGNSDAEKLWKEKGMDALLLLVQQKQDTSAYAEADVKTAEYALQEGIYYLKTLWGCDHIGSDMWEEHDMDAALRGQLSADKTELAYQQQTLANIQKVWDNGKMDDVALGIYHGVGGDMTEKIEQYIALMENDPAKPELQGCVAVTEELAELLHQLYSKYVFQNTLHDFLKFCFYYNYLGE